MKKLLHIPHSGIKSLLCLCLIFFSVGLFAQQVSGTIKDSDGSPIIGASVLVKGTSNGTITDDNGAFSLNNVAKSSTLVVSFVGFKTVEVNADGSLSITLEGGDALDEVVVTGVFDKRTRMESSIAISTLNSKQLERIVPNSGIDLLKNMPGVYVNGARGEVSGSVTTRGFTVGGGFYYVSMQEDGLPIMAVQGNSATDPIFKPDGFLRADATIARVEAVRGGTASILGANAPGGIFNYVSKAGGEQFAGEARVRLGLEGDGKNPLYRAELNFGGPLSTDKSLTYNVGGFYRYGNGPKYPGYPLAYGGQFKGNIQKRYKTGSIKLYAKVLNDHVAQFEFTPSVNFTDPKPAGSFTPTSSTLIQGVKFTVPNATWGGRQGIEYDSEKLGVYKDNAIDLSWEQRLGEGWTINNNLRFSKKATDYNATAVAFPFRVDQATFYGVSGNLGPFGTRVGTYEFYDPKSGKSYGKVRFNNPGNIVAENLTLPGGDVMQNGILYNPMAYNEIRYTDFMDQLTISKKLENMSFTGGLYIANSRVTRLGAGPAAQGFATIEDKPKLLGIRYTNFAGKTFQITNGDGIANLGGSGYNTNDAKVNQSAFFFGHDWQVNDKINFDWGVRYERFGINSKFTVPSRSPDNKFGADNDSLTIYDNRVWVGGAEKSFEKNLNTFSYSAGLNYKITNNFAVYGRFSQGRKSPDLGFFMDVANQQLTSSISAEAQDMKMFEAGLKVKTKSMSLFVTPFYNIIDNIPNFQIFQNPDASYYAPPRLYQKVKTQGVEIEGNFQFTKTFSLRAVAVIQGAKAERYSVYLARNNGSADDSLVVFHGNKLDNVAPLMATLAPTYSNDKFYASLNIQYMGKRWANVGNAFELPAFTSADLNLGYNISKNFLLSASINNLLNTYGVMSWAAPGGFPASLDTQGFTKQMLAANPNSVYSTLAIMPRAYFLTATYKF